MSSLIGKRLHHESQMLPGLRSAGYGAARGIMKRGNVEAGMIRLRYDRKWIEYDFLDANIIDVQLREFEAEGDDCPEHLRFHVRRGT